MKRLYNILSNIILKRDKNRADYIATDSEMINHLINVVRDQSTKNIKLINKVKVKIQHHTVTDSDLIDVEREMGLLTFYQKELHNRFLNK